VVGSEEEVAGEPDGRHVGATAPDEVSDPR
jgi:hypothetical protein